MPLKKFKPVTPSNRYKEWPSYEEITKTTPEKSLTRPLKKSGGRNNQGRITCRHKGGGHKRKYRLVDFKRNKQDVPATVISIEYDPNRTCRIALIQYEDGVKSYILAPVGLEVGATVISSNSAAPKPGNAMTLNNVPLGTAIHNIEMSPGTGGKIARSAGQQAVLSNREEGGHALVKMPSGEIRKFNGNCLCTIGQVGNRDHMNEVSGKAGRSRWKGIRPTVRGMCMNPVDHPNGGGEGKSKSGGGRQHLTSPWGHTKGQKTRKKYKPSNKFIVSRRKKK
ncbi:50S ribosomal protein L2 [Verrucomicrobiaceae bacterium R5-34]|uniref:Large ribosomal subunit protein uL2 n=1 Tax=Oceaniferula flava TaxID=2800421 RepID=A0AAE2SCZ3_9BACT|nr:50S ribosomal protein L2 [Oceaniferula flavus]MBK1831803.1 50S ribosomal protein L2 [Verrucomicrobiaceae bacterium R5-34]MBK1856128.1 50S ribosomal protein L2 [Oceaniferula flavus]MBM1137435.1 50S ribosomal protein L2 [Oceaniferula flavus]